MDLDELKNAWKKTDDKVNTGNPNIFETIRNKSAGPVVKLKRRFKRGMVLIPIITSLGVIELSKQPGLIPQILAWYFLGFSTLMIIYFYLNYRLMSRMQALEGNVKDNLQKQVRLLTNGLRWRLLITRGMVVIFIVLTELLILLDIVPKSEGWGHRSWFVRLGLYAVFIVFFYFLTKFATASRYKKHIQHLKLLMEQME